MFSKRHYDADESLKQLEREIAETIYKNHCQLILEMIDTLERDNAKFNRVKFIDACGLAIDKPEIEDWYALSMEAQS